MLKEFGRIMEQEAYIQCVVQRIVAVNLPFCYKNRGVKCLKLWQGVPKKMVKIKIPPECFPL